MHDYVPFYFGYLSPMLLQLKTGRVAGYTEGQEPLIYLQTTVQAVIGAGRRFVFSDGHGIAAFTHWFDDLARLDQVDWEMVYQRYWRDERQRHGPAAPQASRVSDPRILPLGADSGNRGLQHHREDPRRNHSERLHADHRKLVNIRPGWYDY